MGSARGMTAESRVVWRVIWEKGPEAAVMPVMAMSPAHSSVLLTPAPGERLPRLIVIYPRCSLTPRDASTATTGFSGCRRRMCSRVDFRFRA